MIDIHSHVLFDVDDGATTIEDSIALLKQAKEVGYTDIVCSSHFYTGRFENENYNKNFEILKEKIKTLGIGINIHKGNEIYLSADVFEKFEKINTINGTDYILVEFKKGLLYPVYKSFLEKVIELGYIPVLAHIERYPFIKFEEFKELYSLGVIFQMNIKTVEALTPKVEYFLKNGYIKLVATDTHNLLSRSYQISEYLTKLKTLINEDSFLELTEKNPRKILNNEKINMEIKGEPDEKQQVISFSSLFKSIWSKLFSRA